LSLQKFECTKDNESEYLNNTVCKLKILKKGSYEISGYVDILIPMTYIYVDYKLIFTTSNKILFNYTFEYCSSYEHLPPFFQIVTGYIKTFSKNFIHACPYNPQKRFGLENIPFDANLPFLALANFQKGEYRSVLHSTDKKGKLIIDVNFLFTISQKRGIKKG
jgi:hypothetical protein